MPDRTTTKRLVLCVILLTASGMVLVGVAAGTKSEVAFFIGLILLFLTLVPATLSLVRYGRHMTDLEKRIDALESRKQQQD